MNSPLSNHNHNHNHNKTAQINCYLHAIECAHALQNYILSLPLQSTALEDALQSLYESSKKEEATFRKAIDNLSQM